MTRRSRLVLRPRIERLDGRCLPAALTPVQVAGAYGLDAVTFPAADGSATPGDGSGQTIAIVAAYHNPYVATALSVFNARYNLPGPRLSVVSMTSRTDVGWAEEMNLDVQWAHAAAPGADLLVVEAASASQRDILAAINVARNAPGVSVISMSFGASEFRGAMAYDSSFTTPAGRTGVTFVAAAGDAGAGAEWPSSSPNVVAVGGTSLVVTPTGSTLSETSWSSSGGGTSRFGAEPAYQRAVQNTGRRTTPDVALIANPATGASVYNINPRTGQGVWEQVGGTSLSAPIFAGLIAVANQGRALRGLGPLDGPTQTLPAMYAAAGTDAYDDIAVGSRADAGYDTVTGLGSPNAPALVSRLVATTTVTPLTTSFAANPNAAVSKAAAGNRRVGRGNADRTRAGRALVADVPDADRSGATPSHAHARVPARSAPAPAAPASPSARRTHRFKINPTRPLVATFEPAAPIGPAARRLADRIMDRRATPA